MATIKKAKYGDGRITRRQEDRLGRISEKNPERAKDVAERMRLRATRRQRGRELYNSLAPKEDLPAFKARTMAEAKDNKKAQGGSVKKSFPDLNKDGKITKADILKGRGVIAKKGTNVKKAQAGLTASNKRVGPSDPNGAWTKVQEMNLPPRNVKTSVSLKKDKQLGATKMMNMGGKAKAKKK